MDLSSFSSVHLSFAKCITELVLNSLNANATCIAIRIHDGKRMFQVVDNGLGISRYTMRTVGETESKGLSDFSHSEGHILSRIRKFTDSMIVTSRKSNSNTTYTKVFQSNKPSNIMIDENRPSCGTTVTVHGFYDLSFNKWDRRTVSYAIGNIALNCPSVSFSIRDDEEQKLKLELSKLRRPMSVLKALYPGELSQDTLWFCSSNQPYSDTKFRAFMGVSKVSPAKQYVFLNNRPMCDSTILQLIDGITTAFVNEINQQRRIGPLRKPTKESVFILLFISCTRNRPLDAHSLRDRIGKCVIQICTGSQLSPNPSRSVVKLVTRMTVEHLQGKISRGKERVVINIPKAPNNKQSLPYIPWSGSKLLSTKYHKNQEHGTYSALQIVRKRITRTKVMEIESNKTPVSNHSKFNYNNHTSPQELKDRWQLDISKHNFDYLNELCDFITPDPKRMKKTITENFTLSLSVLSKWSYPSIDECGETEKKENNVSTIPRRFDFLPPKLNALVPNVNKKLISFKDFSDSDRSILSITRRYGLRVPETLNHWELDVRHCRTSKKFSEFRFDKDDLNFLQVLGQICNQVIAGLVNRKGMKVLLLIDQHAVHERIRYEDLLNKYTSFGRQEFLSIRLKEPIVIELLPDTYRSVIFNKELFRKYGIKLSSFKYNTVIIHSVPECLKRHKYQHDDVRLKACLQSLINEVLQSAEKFHSFSLVNLPSTLQNAIASEACHGAIKFGDRLSLDQCKSLVELLKRTKIPTQCAHGRPSIVPMLDLSDWDRSRKKVVQKKLNLERLKEYRREM